MRIRSAAVVTVVASLGLVGAVASPAQAGGAPAGQVKVVAKGLDGPFGLQGIGNNGVVVAENASGEVTRIYRNGRQRVILEVDNVSGVAAGYGHVFALTGAGGPPEEGPPPPAPNFPGASVIRTDYQGRAPKVIADLMAYELANNPDKQPQTMPDGSPVEDALANPFSMNLSKFGLLVADGGANAVLRVDPHTGKVSTFFVPPNVTWVPECLKPESQANPGVVGCDSVPTGVDVVGNYVYVSTEGAGAPGGAKVYKLNRHGKVVREWGGFTGLTGVTVTPWGTIYASEVGEGAPQGEGPPPPDFDPATVGQVIRIANGKVSKAQVTMPIGLDFRNGKLYSTAWSIAHFFGIEHAGQVVKVPSSAFR